MLQLTTEIFRAELARAGFGFCLASAEGDWSKHGSISVASRFGYCAVEAVCRKCLVQSNKEFDAEFAEGNALLMKQIKGAAAISYRESKIMLSPQEHVLLDLSPGLGIEFLDNYSRFFWMKLPKSELFARGEEVEFGRVCNASSGEALALNAVLAGSTLSRLDASADVPFVIQLCRIAFASRRSSASSPNVKGTRFDEAMMVLDANLTSPELSLEWLAASSNVSARQLQREFRIRGMTFSQIVAERRVALATVKIRRNLSGGIPTNISHTAFECGFRDISSFNRTFKRVNGCCPSDFFRSRS